jgi:hypothetical protein
MKQNLTYTRFEKGDIMRYLKLCIGLATLLVTQAAVANTGKKTLCVYDPAGGNGDIFNMMKQYQIGALPLGVSFELKPYTNEKTAAADFQAKQCDAVLVTGTRARPFHKFAGTLEAMGALPDYKNLNTIVKALARPGAAKFMKSGAFESAGIFPAGAVYLFVNDKSINNVEKLAGKRLATLAFDEAAKTMVRKVGASMTAADVSTFAPMFNNGSVDACYAPAFAYKALELYKGIGSKGGVIRYPLAQMTMQLLIRSADFPADYPQKSRVLAAKNFASGLKISRQAESAIPSKHWIDIPDADKKKYDQMFLDVRVELRDTQKVYHPVALKLMRKIRCKADPSRAECVMKRE